MHTRGSSRPQQCLVLVLASLIVVHTLPNPATPESNDQPENPAHENGDSVPITTHTVDPVDGDTSLALRRLKDMLVSEDEEETSDPSDTEVASEAEKTDTPADSAVVGPEDSEAAPLVAENDGKSELSEARARAEQAEEALAQLQQETSEKIAGERREADAAHTAEVEVLQARATEQREAVVSEAQAAAQAELSQALAESAQQHDAALAQVRADAQHTQSELATLQAELSDRVEEARREAYSAYATKLSEMESRVSATREAHAAAEASFARKQAETAARHKEALARVRSDAERARSRSNSCKVMSQTRSSKRVMRHLQHKRQSWQRPKPAPRAR